VESLVCQHGHLVLDALWNSQPIAADESISDVITETQAENELCCRIQQQLESSLQIGWEYDEVVFYV